MTLNYTPGFQSLNRALDHFGPGIHPGVQLQGYISIPQTGISNIPQKSIELREAQLRESTAITSRKYN